MKQFLLISKKFEGYIIYSYNERGILCHWQNCTWEMSEDMQVYALKELGGCLTIDKFHAWLENTGHGVIAINTDLSFERFWLEYDKQKDKQKAETVWYKLSNKEKLYIFHNIQSYHRYIRQNSTWYNQQYPEGYLKGGYRSEWDKMALAKAADKPVAAAPVQSAPKYKAKPRTGATSDGASIGEIMDKIKG